MLGDQLAVDGGDAVPGEVRRASIRATSSQVRASADAVDLTGRVGTTQSGGIVLARDQDPRIVGCHVAHRASSETRAAASGVRLWVRAVWGQGPRGSLLSARQFNLPTGTGTAAGAGSRDTRSIVTDP
ncbi:hypothetical protein [Isoptericola sp. NPDC057653]|uniref:hypothetical protein n=1 Tax=Isoptericola sp. NPDC057653 TaxID=3346195 RepID=UPI0036C5CDAB